MVAHILSAGVALCGLKGAPGQWPVGNVWVRNPNELPKNRAYEICGPCRSEFDAITSREPEPKTCYYCGQESEHMIGDSTTCSTCWAMMDIMGEREIKIIDLLCERIGRLEKKVREMGA